MLALIGTIAVFTGLAAAAALVQQSMRALRTDEASPRGPRIAAFAMLAAMVVAFATMEVALVTDDFSIRYVADQHARATPLLFSIATAWAALEGSLLLWALILAGFTALVVRSVGDGDRLGLGASAVMGGVALFFIGLLAIGGNPFEAVSPVPPDGPGPNPLLQNHVLMAVHPPLLYLGYVGMTAPFAFAVAALALRERGPAWVQRTRRWTLIAWSFLTAGIAVGAWWSYEVLGWGGYWAWDPVENASFLPWLLATAYLHSAVVQARRGLLGAWSVALILGTFSLTILGTFLTRSGVIASVHSFTQSPIGPALLAFLVVVSVGSFGLFAVRAGDVSSIRPLESLASREGVFLVNNLLLTVFTFTVLSGTLFPIILEAVNGQEVSVGRPYFDRMAVPIALALLLAMGLGPLTPWRSTTRAATWARVRTPVMMGLVAGAVVVVAGIRSPYLVLVVFIVAVLIAEAGVLLARGAAGRRGGRAQRMVDVVRADPRFWGGQLAHIGIAVVALGIASSTVLAEKAVLRLDEGRPQSFGGYSFTYVGGVDRREAGRTIEGARVVVARGDRVRRELRPALRKFDNQVQPIDTPAVWTSLTGEDLYLTMTTREAGRATITVRRYPQVFLVWTGGGICALGGAFSALASRRRRRIELDSDSPRAAAEPVHV